MGSHKHHVLKGKQCEVEPGSTLSRLPIIGAVLAVIGLGGGAAMLGADPGAFWHAYLAAFMFALALGLGGLFFTMIQHVVRAGWSVGVRRMAENMAITVPVTAIFGGVLLFGGGPHVFEWMHEEVPYETTDCAKIGIRGINKEGKVTGAVRVVAPANRDDIEYVWLEADGKVVGELELVEGGKAAHEARASGEHHGGGHDEGGHEGGEEAHAPKRIDAKYPWTLAKKADVQNATNIVAKASATGGYVVTTPVYTRGVGPQHVGGHGHGAAESCYKMQPLMDDKMLSFKSPYLNPTASTIRYVIYLAIWTLLAVFFWGTSRRMDLIDDKDEIARLSHRMRVASAPGILAFALTMTFAAFDFLMSLDPHWFSTMFGVYYFTGAFLTTNSFLAVVLALMLRAGYLEGVVTQEHFHDLGKLMFGFTVFWAYIAFSQYFLIWYADIPEETHWFAYRGHGQWLYLSLAIVFGRFVFPWFLLLRRGWKRTPNYVLGMGLFIILMEFVDMFWLVAPARAHHRSVAATMAGDLELAHEISTTIPFGAVDILCLVGFIGVFLGVFGYSLVTAKLVPVKDPRIDESINFENF